MLRDIFTLQDLTLSAVDGELGAIDDVYFSDDAWTVRYLVVDTGPWLTGRRVLISPCSVEKIDIEGGLLHVSLTCDQVKNSPDFDSDKPVSRQYESAHSAYYGYSSYWEGPYLWGASPNPIALAPQGQPMSEGMARRIERARDEGDPHLRSADDVSGHAVEATDGSVGHIVSFLIDDKDWSIGAIVVDTRNWWPGKHVVIPPDWIDSIDWPNRRVRVRVGQEIIKHGLEYDADAPIDADYFGRLKASSQSARQARANHDGGN